MGTNMYPSSALLGQNKDEPIAALPIDELIEKADGFAGVFPDMDEIHVCEVAKNTDDVFVDKRLEWIPDVEEEFKPVIRSTFNCLDEAENFYKTYARKAGFGVRNSTTRYFQNSTDLRSKVFVCSKEGIAKSQKKNKGKSIEISEYSGQQEDSLLDMNDGNTKRVRRNHQISRENCKACMSVSKNKDQKWEIVKLVENHSHILTTPRKTQMYTVLEIEAGGAAKVGCLEKDIWNIQTKEREEKRLYDAQLLIEHFLELKEMNDSFYYAYERDDEKKLKYCFWADGVARKNYHHFHDVLIFDTTYDTNTYSMIFAPFTGVNNHRLSVTFGCGFLRDEKIESFIWLFEKFLEAMSGVHPKSIITDQDPTMRAAISRIFVTTYHRFCTWHILKKETNKLGTIASKETFNKPFHHCIWSSRSIEEFESEWEKIIILNELQDNSWLCDLYDIRHKWVPIFSKHIFSAGIRSTQRRETMNSFFGKYVSKQNTLMEFIIRFERAIKRQRNMEVKQMEISEHTHPKLMTPFKVEKEMAKIYTREMFKRFQVELSKSLVCFSSGIVADDSAQHFNVTCLNEQMLDSSVNNISWLVTNDVTDRMVKCSCKKFESEGIPCSHLLYVLRMIEGDILSHVYILDRWTINIVKDKIFDKNGIELRGDDDIPLVHSKNEIYSIVSSWVDKAYTSEETLCFVKEMLTDIGNKLEEMTLSSQPEESHLLPDRNQSQKEVIILPPEKSKTKGSGKRIKGAKEIAIEHGKGRLCNGCNQRGVDHDKRNCPLLNFNSDGEKIIQQNS